MAIKTAAEAEAFLAERGITVEGGLALVPCPRCAGSGHYSFTPSYGTRCFQCHGQRYRRVPALKRARQVRDNERARARKEAKRTESQRAFQDKAAREATEFDRRYPSMRAALRPYLEEKQHPILSDMARRLERYGSLSDKAVAFAERLVAEAAAPKPTLEEGRRELQGQVLKVDYYESGYGSGQLKMLVKLDDGCRVFGTVPRGLSEVSNGDRVRFRATVTAKEQDFGFFKRPTIV